MNALNLAGVPIDELQISLGADTTDTNTANIDNVVLNAAVTPIGEPSSFVLLGTGVLGGVFGVLRRRFAA
jgi:hypothetical protein